MNHYSKKNNRINSISLNNHYDTGLLREIKSKNNQDYFSTGKHSFKSTDKNYDGLKKDSITFKAHSKSVIDKNQENQIDTVGNG